MSFTVVIQALTWQNRPKQKTEAPLDLGPERRFLDELEARRMRTIVARPRRVVSRSIR